jgi:hypothetical protein
MRCLGGGDERVDLRLVVEAVAERIGPERPELAARGRRRSERELARDRPERVTDERQDERERKELQFPFPIADLLG